MRRNLRINHKVVLAVALSGLAVGTALFPIWSVTVARAGAAPAAVHGPTAAEPKSTVPQSTAPASAQSGGWFSLLSSAGAALYWGAETTMAGSQQAAEGAYYLGGELIESGRIVGIHALRAMGISGNPRSFAERKAQEDQLVKEWDKTGTAFENSPTADAVAAGTAPSNTAASRAAITPATMDAAVKSPSSLLKQVALKSGARSESPADAGTMTTDSETPRDNLVAQCDWPGLTASTATSIDGDGIRILTELGLMSEGAQRMSDGTVFFPKVSQRLLQIRTGYACEGAATSSRRLVGHVIANPTSSGLVQADQDGRVETGEFGFPKLGQRVQQGELLGYLVPTWSSRDRAEVEAEIEILRGEVAKLELELARTREVPLLPFRDGRILSLRLDLNKLRAQRDALIDGLQGRQPLTASVSGIVARAQVRVGQVVEARELLWEIANTEDLWVEAEWFGNEPLDENLTASAVTGDGQVIRLDYQGSGWALEGGQSAPLQFRARSVPDGVRIGEQMTVHVRQNSKTMGTLIPKSALVRRGNGEMTVWQSITPERFEPIRVSWKPVDGNVVLVEGGLPKRARVVVAGSSLLSEIR